MPSSPQEPSVDTIARTAWGEARNQGEIGMQAVIDVIMNRVALRTWYGLNPIAVCLKSFQFSCWNRGDTNRDKILAANDNDPQFAIALKLARLAVSGGLPDITEGATHYYAVGTSAPAWAKTMVFTIQIGEHRFYKVAS